MSYQIRSWDDLSDACKDFLKEYSISELLEIVGDAIERVVEDGRKVDEVKGD